MMLSEITRKKSREEGVYVLKSENISELKKKIKQKHSVAYELDLKNDIDREKTPHNELKQTEEYCEFVCEKGTEITLGDFETIFGRLEKKEGYLAGILQEQSFFKSENNPAQEKIFSAILPLPDEYDILNVNFRGKTEQCYKMFIYTHELYEIKKEIKAGVYDEREQFQKNYIASLQNRFVAFNFEQKNNLSIFAGNKISQCISFRYDCQDTISFYFDYKAGSININNQKWCETYSVIFDNLNYFEMYANFQNDTSSFDNNAFDIYKAVYAKNGGYIYLKPITLPKGNYKIFMYYTGELALEYSNGNSSTWEKFPSTLRLTEKGDLMLRLKMNSGDKLYDLLIVSRNK